MTFGELEAAIKRAKSLTDKPFGVNMRADATDAADRIDLVIREGVKVASFALAPKKELIAKLKDHGVVVIPSDRCRQARVEGGVVGCGCGDRAGR